MNPFGVAIGGGQHAGAKSLYFSWQHPSSGHLFCSGAAMYTRY